MARILILGGGFGGLAAAHALLPALAEGHALTLVERKRTFAMGLAKLWVLTGERPPEAGRGDLAALEEKGVERIEAEVERIDLDARAVETTRGRRAFDFLVVAMGAETPAAGVPGLRAEQNLYDAAAIPGLRDRLAAIERGRVAIVIAGAPYKCPPAPFEAAMLVHALLVRRGVRERVALEVAIPDAEPMPVAGPEIGRRVRALLLERGIEVRSGEKPASVGERDVLFPSGARLAYDVLLAVPPHTAPAAVRAAGLTDASGFVPVDPRTLATAREGVYAVGDVAVIRLAPAGMLPKAGLLAERQGEVVGRNLLARLRGEAEEAAFDGAGACFFEVGERRAMLVEGSFYSEPGKRVRLGDPSAEVFARKVAFERERLARWFGPAAAASAGS
jgi:sulfide:quinone oxidoreductase